VVLGAAVALVASACGGSADDGGTGSSGVRGTTDVDAGCPPSPATTACPRRPLAARLRFVRQDRSAPDVVILTGPDGAFTVDLPPGRYELVPDNLTGAPLPRADRRTVEVHQGEFTRVTVEFDSGVR
jgi:hypothetical protein